MASFSEASTIQAGVVDRLVQADMGWSAQEVRDGIGTLIAEGFLEYDEEASVVFLPKALKYHSPGSDNQLKGAIHALQRVPDTTLWGRFLEAAAIHAEKLYERLIAHSQADLEALPSDEQ